MQREAALTCIQQQMLAIAGTLHGEFVSVRGAFARVTPGTLRVIRTGSLLSLELRPQLDAATFFLG